MVPAPVFGQGGDSSEITRTCRERDLNDALTLKRYNALALYSYTVTPLQLHYSPDNPVNARNAGSVFTGPCKQVSAPARLVV
jgi:hypothetical protein